MPLSAVEPASYEKLLAEKSRLVESLLAPFSAPAAEIFPSASTAYRMRAEFRIWHQGEDLNYVMYRRDDPKTPVNITQFPIACEQIQRLMPVLREQLRGNTTLRRKLFQVEFLSTLAGDTLLTLAYHRKLDEAWLAKAGELSESLGVSVVGRSRKQKVVVGRDYVEERLAIGERDYHYRQYEQAFTQPNALVNIKMIEWACAQAASLEGDLLELYCGNGNFTLPLANHFGTVIATEMSKSSIRAARENLAANAVGNVQMIRLAAEEVTQAMNGERLFRRLADLPKPLQEYELRTLFVDPPRAGLDPHTLQMAAGFDTILYISCNPQTLAANLAQLSATHSIDAFALFDQFPYTHHMECGVLLRRGPTRNSL